MAPRRPLGMRVLRWAAGGAIAASVAVVALVASRPPAPDNGSATPAPLVAATNAAPAAATVGQLRQPLLPMPTAFADYTTPASFDSIIPNYAAPRPANSGGNEAFVPYVLVVVPRQSLQQQPAPRQDAPPQQ